MFAPRIVAALLAILICLAGLQVGATTPDVVLEDRERIQEHLAEVETELRERDVSHLSESLQKERERNLDVLADYRKAGEFPRNTHVPWRQPVFIDRGDRACAVAHLMIESGWDQEARAISERENLGYLLEMESPEVEEWVAQSGLTAEEAAEIQPTYSPCNECTCDEDPVCGDDGETYVNSCVAEKCAHVDVVGQGCCADGDAYEHDIEDMAYYCDYDGGPKYCTDNGGGDDVGTGSEDAGVTGADAGNGGSDAGSADAGWNLEEDDSSSGSEEYNTYSRACSSASSGVGTAASVVLMLLLVLGVRPFRRSEFVTTV